MKRHRMCGLACGGTVHRLDKIWVGMTFGQARNNSMDRWTPRMLPALPEATWRKSSQWVALTRTHAMRTVEDTVINRVIRKHCTYGYDSYLRRHAPAALLVQHGRGAWLLHPLPCRRHLTVDPSAANVSLEALVWS